MSAFGCLPAGRWQSLVGELTPGATTRRFRRLAALPRHHPSVQAFVAVQDWLAAAPALPGTLATGLVWDLHVHNLAATGRWRIDARIVRPECLTIPVFVAVARHDPLFPQGSMACLAEVLRHPRVAFVDGDQLDMLAGRRARQQAWRPLLSWLVEQRHGPGD